jgi:hypothetical protein
MIDTAVFSQMIAPTPQSLKIRQPSPTQKVPCQFLRFLSLTTTLDFAELAFQLEVNLQEQQKRKDSKSLRGLIKSGFKKHTNPQYQSKLALDSQLPFTQEEWIIILQHSLSTKSEPCL